MKEGGAGELGGDRQGRDSHPALVHIRTLPLVPPGLRGDRFLSAELVCSLMRALGLREEQRAWGPWAAGPGGSREAAAGAEAGSRPSCPASLGPGLLRDPASVPRSAPAWPARGR